MNDLHILRTLVTELVRFCPICGQEMEKAQAKHTTITPHPDGSQTTTVEVESFKTCREGHGSTSFNVESLDFEIVVEFEISKEFLRGE